MPVVIAQPQVPINPPTFLRNRLTPHVSPKEVKGVQDHQHPPEQQLNYNNQMVGVIYNDSFAEFNVMMSDGNHGTLDYTNKREIKMTKQEPVAKIVVYQEDSEIVLCGFRFYSATAEVLLEVGECDENNKYAPPTEFALEAGERVLGIKSKLSDEGQDPYHCDLLFVIGKMEA